MTAAIITGLVVAFALGWFAGWAMRGADQALNTALEVTAVSTVMATTPGFGPQPHPPRRFDYRASDGLWVDANGHAFNIKALHHVRPVR